VAPLTSECSPARRPGQIASPSERPRAAALALVAAHVPLRTSPWRADHDLAMAKTESRKRELVLQGFYDLSLSDQLVAHRAIRDHLGEHVVESRHDQVIDERAGALEALRAAAVHLRLEEGAAPTPAEFETAARELGLGWTKSRVQRAWGKWRFAKQALINDGTRESWRQRDSRLNYEGRRRTHEEHVAGLRLWLASNPNQTKVHSYEQWAREYNETRGRDRRPVVTRATAVMKALGGMRWVDVVRLARGEITQEKGTVANRRKRERTCRGPYDLVGTNGLRDMFGGETEHGLLVKIGRPDFPRPILVIANQQLWERSDVESFVRGKPFPSRVPNEDRGLYLTRREVADLCDLHVELVSRGGRGIPQMAVVIGRVHLWLREEVEAFAGSEEAESLVRRRRSRQRSRHARTQAVSDAAS
jgi:hypothetical protein